MSHDAHKYQMEQLSDTVKIYRVYNNIVGTAIDGSCHYI